MFAISEFPEWLAKTVTVTLGVFAVIRFLVVYCTAREMKRNLKLLLSYCEKHQGSSTVPEPNQNEELLQAVALSTARQLIMQHIPERQGDLKLESILQSWIYRGLSSSVHRFARQVSLEAE